MLIGDVVVTLGDRLITWTSGISVDFDGAPNCAAPKNSGFSPLDVLANAGHPGNWWGLACDSNGEPFVQGPDDPFPGYYISQTALCDHTKLPNDPARYVDASTVPYVSIPRTLLQCGAKVGDLCLVQHLPIGTACAAIVADVGGSSHIGEGSAALCTALGLLAGRTGGAESGIAYTLFLGTSRGWPRTQEDINATVNQLAGGIL